MKQRVDFVLISAHGYADSLSSRGAILLEKAVGIRPAFFQRNSLKLVYIDGCQQGINLAYILALSESSHNSFFIGPIISNDSGDSSTKTIVWFFAQLQSGKDPVGSLWQTRNQLYRHYKNKVKALDRINKSIIFRIYQV